jgi:calcineurin-like phosphoesterase family protein
MKLGPVLYVGDPHGRLEHIVECAQDHGASAVVLLGDIQSPQALHIALEPIQDRVWFIHGNHDTDTPTDFEHLWDSRLADRNVHGRVVVLPDGTRLAGLGGVFRHSIFDPGERAGPPRYRNAAEHGSRTPRQSRWRDGPPLRHWSTIYPDDLAGLAALQADVLISHEAPGYHPHGFGVLDTLARAMGVRLSVHGHHHDALDSSARWAEQGFKSFGVGQAGVSAIDLGGQCKVLVV